MTYDEVTMNTSEYYGMLTAVPAEVTLTTEEPLSSYTRSDMVIISILVVAVIIVIVVGNAIVVGLVVMNRRLRPVQNLFIASLALSDLFVGLLIMPLSLVNELIGYWCFGQVLCELWLAFDVLLCTASILNLCLISVDRYLCITRAMTYPSWRSKQRALWMIAVVWVLAMVVCFPPLAGWKRPQGMKQGRPLCELSSEVGYVVYSTLGSFFIPLVVMLAVYVQIYRAVRHQVRRRMSLRYDPGSAAAHAHKEEIRHIIRHHENMNRNNADDDDDNMHADLPPSDDDLEELEMNLVTYHPEEEEEENTKVKAQEVNMGKLCGPRGETDDPLTNPSGTDEDVEKCITEEATSLIDSNDEMAAINNKTANDSAVQLLPLAQQANYCLHEDVLVVQNPHAKLSSSVGLGSPDHTKAYPTQQTIDSETKDAKRCVRVYRLWRWHPSRQRRNINNIFRNCFNKHKHHKVPKIHHNKAFAPKEHKDARRWRVARARERRLTIILGVIMAAFVFCWFPFFSTYLVSSITGLPVPKTVFDVFFWGGYCNSALNPVIYTIFNRDIRLCKSRGQ